MELSGTVIELGGTVVELGGTAIKLLISEQLCFRVHLIRNVSINLKKRIGQIL